MTAPAEAGLNLALKDELTFRELVERSAAAIYLVEDGRFTYANPRLCQILGYAIHELRGSEVLPHVVEEDRDRLVENRRRALAGDAAALRATYRLRRKGGEVIHLAVDGRLSCEGGRHVTLGVAQDITAEVVAQQMRVAAEKHYAVLAEQSIVGTYVRDETGILYASPRLLEILGRRPDELRPNFLVNTVVAEDRPVLEDVLARRMAGERGPIRFMCRVRRGDGRIVHIEAESQVVEVGGRLETMGVVQDVSQRERAAEALRESEEKYRSLWEASGDAIVLIDGEGLIQYANPSVQALFGYEPHELLGRHVGVLQPAAGRERHERAFADFLRHGERAPVRRSIEVTALHRDGREVPVEMSFSRLRLANRTVFAAFARDIRDRKAAEAALQRAYAQMEALSERILDIQDEERRTLSLELHDDIGQSIVALRIGLYRLAGELDPAKAALLEQCVEVAGSLQRKVRDLSRQLHPAELAQVALRDALRSLAERQQELTDVEVLCDFSGDDAQVPPAVAGACFRICQEALSNAARHSGASAIRVSLEIDPRMTRLAVADDGRGFDAAALRERASPGGLGLAGMEQRARRAGGRLVVTAAPAAGTTVEATFPLQAAEA